MSEPLLTVRGRAAAKPTLIETATGNHMVRLRLGVNPRHFDRAANQWVDGTTQWYTVLAFGTLAQNIALSVAKGDPLVVHGRFRTSEWESEGRTNLTLELLAITVGHDLGLGVTNYARIRRAEPVTDGEARAENGNDTALDGDHLDAGDEFDIAPDTGAAELDEALADHEAALVGSDA